MNANSSDLHAKSPTKKPKIGHITSTPVDKIHMSAQDWENMTARIVHNHQIMHKREQDYMLYPISLEQLNQIFEMDDVFFKMLETKNVLSRTLKWIKESVQIMQKSFQTCAIVTDMSILHFAFAHLVNVYEKKYYPETIAFDKNFIQLLHDNFHRQVIWIIVVTQISQEVINLTWTYSKSDLFETSMQAVIEILNVQSQSNNENDVGLLVEPFMVALGQHVTRETDILHIKNRILTHTEKKSAVYRDTCRRWVLSFYNKLDKKEHLSVSFGEIPKEFSKLLEKWNEARVKELGYILNNHLTTHMPRYTKILDQVDFTGVVTRKK